MSHSCPPQNPEMGGPLGGTPESAAHTRNFSRKSTIPARRPKNPEMGGVPWVGPPNRLPLGALGGSEPFLPASQNPEMGGPLGGTPKSSQGQMAPKAASAVKASAGQKRSGSLLYQAEQPRAPRKIVRKKSTDDMVGKTLRGNFCDMPPEEDARPSTNVMTVVSVPAKQ